MTVPPAIRNIDPVNAKSFDYEAPFSERRYEYLVSKRDQMNDRIRTGSLALNGSSLVAILATLSGEGAAAKWIGLSETNTAVTAAFLVFGAGCAGASIMMAGALFNTEAADAFDRMLRARRAASTYDAIDSPTARSDSLSAVTDLHAAPLIDFQYSKASIALQSLGAASWLAGMCIPLASAFGLADLAARAWAGIAAVF